MAACSRETVDGRPCKLPARPGTTLCRVHIQVKPNRSLYTDELGDRVVGLLRAGNYNDVAARGAGIAPRTFREWLQRGRAGEEPYSDFLARVERAQAEGEALHVARIAEAAREDWHASAWFLERSYPSRWGRVSPRPYDERTATDGPADQRKERGLFDEVDELARKRAERV